VEEDGRLRFRRVPPPSPADLGRILGRVRRRIQDLLAARGYGIYAAPGETEDGQEEPGLLDAVKAASVREWTLFGDQQGPAEVLGRRDRSWDEPRIEKPFTAEGEGYSIHAGVRIRKGDRAGLEKLCRYLLRPPFAAERLSLLPDGRVQYRFRRPRPDGSSHVLLDPLDFMARLASLVPPPRFHLVRYHGILGPHHAKRRKVVPQGGKRRRRRRCEDPETSPELGDLAKRRRLDWATLLKRSMGLDGRCCPACGGRLDFDGCVEEPDEIRAWLRDHGEPEDPPSLSPARPPPQLGFEFDQVG
jgi:hypothetical protein